MCHNLQKTVLFSRPNLDLLLQIFNLGDECFLVFLHQFLLVLGLLELLHEFVEFIPGGGNNLGAVFAGNDVCAGGEDSFQGLIISIPDNFSLW